MPVTDEDAALQAIGTLEHLSAEQEQAQDAINAILRNGEPFVDVQELLAHYNVLYFRKLLIPRVEYRPRPDIINTLLHEAIHAYFFITTSWRHSRGDDGTGHGEGFQLLADAINTHGNYEITVFHTFHDEVLSVEGRIQRFRNPHQQKKKIEAMTKKERAGRQKNKLDGWLKPKPEKQSTEGETYTGTRPSTEAGTTSSGIANGKRKAEAIS
ncbi:hypothetical protein N0V90_006606 [Kalmusia sp. IMI 367209]|nr:hypothetical protein N0V90_006606 [Kalmusia sp. IMI 367209]